MKHTMRRMETGNFGSFRYDPKNDAYEWDEGAIDVLGGQVDDKTTYPAILQHIPPAVRKPYEEWRVETVESSRTSSVRIPFDLEKGRIALEVHLKRRGDIVHGVLVDVTADEKRHELRDAQMQVMHFAERIARFGTWSYDIEADAFFASPGAVDLVLPGADPGEFTFEGVLELVSAPHRNNLRTAYERALETGQVQTAEFRMADTERWFMIQFMRVLDERGEPAYTCGVIHDTTELHVQTTWKQQFETLQDQHELRSRFVNAAAHELNQPLTPMRLQLAMLAERLPEQTDVARSMAVLQRNVDRLEFMLRDLLDATRSQAGRLTVDLDEMQLAPQVDHVVDTLKPLAVERRVDINWKPHDVPAVLGDPMRTQQCLSNLLHNAVKFTKQDTDVDVEPDVTDDFVSINIRDAGPGLDAQQRSLLFEPFSRIHASPAGFPGTGLGLYVCKALMEAMHGSIAVASEPGKGSTFSLEFPRADGIVHAQSASKTAQ